MDKSKKVAYLQVLAFVFALVLMFGYLWYLDAGCGDLGGAMTWGGKVCVSSL